MVVIRNDDAVLHRVSTNNAAGRNLQVEDGVACGRKLVYQFLGGGSVVECALVGFFQNHNATALDARVVGGHGGGDEIRKRNIGNEPAALIYLQPGLLAV